MRKRKIKNYIGLLISTISAFIGLFFLLWIIVSLIEKGFHYVNWSVFTQNAVSPGDEGGGLKFAILGQLEVVGIASLLGIPAGILGGIYLSEYGKDSVLSNVIRNVSDAMTSIPSIITGIFVYAIVVVPMGGFSVLAGSIALALLMMPIVISSIDNILRLVPNELREAAYALGAPKYIVIFKVVSKKAVVGIVSVILLAISRILGETAPLLFTSFNSNFESYKLNKPIATLTVTMYDYAMGPYDSWHHLAWAAAIILTFSVLLFNIASRLFSYWRFSR
ncbi:Phosphate transport system permease protein PstA [Desulfurella amilsii]|uniref:Phosphate transport system permease protein PstA n=1 Tax=Desulfurella amilsii TaxID=1562698 RepID=A0A1X4XZX6_9BACT|nr:phosphate ABC transporter permease PstA [Desulfurella amilsii]OSS43097.1 Phosphate transport system permease protein PstA [Desulfurella amilsii]